MNDVRIIGRSSSHSTRCARIVAHELGVPYELVVTPDALQASSGAWYGSLNICRELARLAHRADEVVWPEDMVSRIACNAQEMVVEAMAAEVTLIMGAPERSTPASAYDGKTRARLQNTMQWLDDHVAQVIGSLPERRRLSFFEVSLFCLATHLPFRGQLEVDRFVSVTGFCRVFAERESARVTPYRFDA